MVRKLAAAAIALALATTGVEVADSLHRTGHIGFVSTAEAVVGRPATPVSVAGVARRTTRRCAADVYNC